MKFTSFVIPSVIALASANAVPHSPPSFEFENGEDISLPPGYPAQGKSYPVTFPSDLGLPESPSHGNSVPIYGQGPYSPPPPPKGNYCPGPKCGKPYPPPYEKPYPLPQYEKPYSPPKYEKPCAPEEPECVKPHPKPSLTPKPPKPAKPTPCPSKPTTCYEKPSPCPPKPTPCYEKPVPCPTKKPATCYEKPSPCPPEPTPCYEKPVPCPTKKPAPCPTKKPAPCPVHPTPAPVKPAPCPVKPAPGCKPATCYQPDYKPVKASHPHKKPVSYKSSGGQCEAGTYACTTNPKTGTPGWKVCNTSHRWEYAGDCPCDTVCKFYEPSKSPYCVPPGYQFPGGPAESCECPKEY